MGLIKDVVRQRHGDGLQSFLRPSVTWKLFHSNKNETFVSAQDCAFGIGFILPGFSFNFVCTHTCAHMYMHTCMCVCMSVHNI